MSASAFAQSGATRGALPTPPVAVASDAAANGPLLQLGPGDSINISVYGQSDMNSTVYVSDDGTVPVALAGPVKVAGMSPSGAAREIEKALRDGMFLNNPQVTITLAVSRSQRVSVLGEVGLPGRYPIESNTSIFDLLAQAGGPKQTASTVIYVVRSEGDGKVTRYPVNLGALNDALIAVPTQSLKGGDSILVPRAEHYYIYGEVAQPNSYPLEPGLTVIEAIVRAGGVTARGSRSRIELQRRSADSSAKDGRVTRKAKPDDVLEPDDIIRVKESIF